MTDDDGPGIYLDGQKYTVDDLTFAERRKMRDYTRSLAPENDLYQSSDIDQIPAFICVVKQRTDPDFTLDQALEFKEGDVGAPPPTRRKTK